MVLFAGIVILVLAIIGAAFNASIQRACPMDPIVVDLGPLPEAKGFWASEFSLEKLEKIVVGETPEDLVVDSQGRVYTGIAAGWIKRINLDGTVDNHTHVGERVLGIALGPEEEIYFVVPSKGLFKVGDDGIVHVLSSEVDGTPYLFLDGVIVAKDGTVYFTDASTKYGFDDFTLDIMEGRPNGRVLKYDPFTDTTSVLVKEMAFPNGVALSENEEFLLISETTRARIQRYWLKGEKEGTVDTFLEGLRSVPDNVRRSETDGNFYIGLSARRSKITDWAFKTPAVKCVMVNPHVVGLLAVMEGGMLVVVSPEGKLVEKYEDPAGKLIKAITGAIRVGDVVYFSTVAGDSIGRLKL